MKASHIGLYRPVWGGAAREQGHDEDVVTLAVAAALPVVGGATEVRRVVVVTPQPDVLEGFGSAVVLSGLALSDQIPVDLRVGSGPTVLTALTEALPGTLVIGVDLAPSAGAGAVLVDENGVVIEAGGTVIGSLPMRVKHVDSPTRAEYDDSRLERERGWRISLDRLLPADGPDGPLAIVGPAAKAAQRLGATVTVPTAGASAPIFALAALAATPGAVIVALDAATGVLVTVGSGATPNIERVERAALPVAQRPRLAEGDRTQIEFSLPAYRRAFAAKTGMIASSCACGAMDFPPRRFCSECGADGTSEQVALPRTGEVYTGVAVNVPVPGIAAPYAVAIAQLDDVPVRVLAHVTDSVAQNPVIGSRGRLVLRRVATREGVPDYGYGWQPQESIKVQEEAR